MEACSRAVHSHNSQPSPSHPVWSHTCSCGYFASAQRGHPLECLMLTAASPPALPPCAAFPLRRLPESAPPPPSACLAPCPAPRASLPGSQADLDSKALEVRKRQEAVPGILNPLSRVDCHPCDSHAYM